MTTLVRTRFPLETLSMSQQPTARRRSKRLQAYDEEDGDFVFTRSKRTKIAQADPEPVPAPPPAAPTVKRGRKTKERHENEADAIAVGEEKPGRRKMGFGTPHGGENEISVLKRRKSTRSSLTGKTQNAEGRGNGMRGREEGGDYDSIDMVGVTEESVRSPVEFNKQATMISLPFSDTPVIKRNKELRRKGGSGARRSSLGLRGRRASSLIDNGHSAIPHREVETKEFFKHIESEGLSEPRRMKQLLTWTGERALGEKPSHGDPDSAAYLAARVIKENLLKDFANKSEFSDWFRREESAPKKIIKTPNPRNVEIEENLADLEERVKRLRAECDQWKALAQPPSSLPPFFSDTTAHLTPSQINTSLLDPEQAAILALLSPDIDTTTSTQPSPASSTTLSSLTTRLQSISSALEFQVDNLTHGVHKLEQYQDTASRVAGRVLALCAVRLEERERKERESVGTRDLPVVEVLRSLSRILPAGGKVGSGSGR